MLTCADVLNLHFHLAILQSCIDNLSSAIFLFLTRLSKTSACGHRATYQIKDNITET